MADIIIKQPKIIDFCEGKSRLVTEIVKDGKVQEIWVQSDEKYKEYMVIENCDAVLCYIFVLAMRRKYDIICEVPVTEILLYKLNEFAKCAYTYSERLHLPKISTKTCNPLPNKGAVVTTATLGVDSFHAINKFLNPPYPSLKLTHIMHNDFLEFKDFRRRYMNETKPKKTLIEASIISESVKVLARKNVVAVAEELNLEYCFFDSNIDTFSPASGFYLTFINSGFAYFSFAKLFGTAIVPGAYDLSHFDVNDIFYKDNTYHEILNLFYLSTVTAGGGIQFISDTFCGDRLDKIREIVNNPIICKYLSVCWYTQNGKNCNICSKCMRTLIMLDYLGVVDRFANSFNIDYYNKNFNTVYKRYLENGIDIKHNLRVEEKRYREIRDTVIAKHKKLL